MIVEPRPIEDFVSFSKEISFSESDQKYIGNLLKLIKDYGDKMCTGYTEYKINNDIIKFYDIKLKFNHSEDDIIKKMYKNWEQLNDSDPPFRRGMCIGIVGTTPFIAVGTIKFFYAEDFGTTSFSKTRLLKPEDVDIQNGNIKPENKSYEKIIDNDKIFISEKANGEFTIFTTIVTKTNKWVLIGSKNVRIVLPVTNSKKVYLDLMKEVPEDKVDRFSYLHSMVDLWLHKIQNDSKLFVISEDYTMIGEQVGVHNHIFTDYDTQDIAIFGLIDKKGHSIDTKVHTLSIKLNNQRTVKVDEISKKDLLDSLTKISEGSIDEYGEGSVIYCYDKENHLTIYKYKNDSYSYIRAIRTKMESFIGKMNRHPEIVHNVVGETVNMVTRVKNDLRFPDTPKDVVDSWVSVMPRMILYIVRHRLTFVAPEFSNNFIRIYEYLVNNPDRYHGKEDHYAQEMTKILTFPIRSKVRDISDIIEDLAKEIIEFRPNLFMFSMPPSSGKCFGYNTPVIMFDGTIDMIQNIKKGDKIMGDDSTFRTVLGTTIGTGKLYEVEQSRGDNYVVNGDHILSLKMDRIREDRGRVSTTVNDVQYEQDEIVDISVKDYLKLSTQLKNKFLKGYKVPIIFKEQIVPLDPYIIGLWLGDGHSHDTGFTNQDSSILKYLANKLPEFHRWKYKCYLQYGQEYTYRINGDNNNVLNVLQNLNLIQNKHIPDIYKYNSRKNQLKLLAGLLDTDGYYDKRGYFEITQKNKILANDIQYISRCLGFSATIKSCEKKSCMYKGEKKTGIYYRQCISGEKIHEIPCLINRKQAIYKKLRENTLYMGINIKPVSEKYYEQGPEFKHYYGFELDGNHRFLLGDHTVSHNSILFKRIREKLIGPHSGFKNIRIFERDTFRMKYAENETVNKHWYENVRNFINKDSDNLAFVGNCFENDFSMRFRQELGKNSNRRTLVARLTDEELQHTDYALTCMKRLANRSTENNDDSTLTMDLGAFVVCNKFFNSKPITKVSKKEAKDVKIVYFKTIDLVEPDTKSSDACWNFRKLFSVSKGPTLRKRMKFTDCKYLSETNKFVGKKPVLIGLYPTNKDVMFKLFDLSSDKLEASDLHVTLKFKPSEEDLSKIDNIPVTLIGKEIVTIEKDSEMLQFIPLPCPEHYDYHVTLGTTNNKVLPCADSGNYLRNPTKFKLENGYKVSKQSIEQIEYVGTQKLFYN
jgi:hypothetical protein